MGASDFIAKPFESRTLISKVKLLLDARPVQLAPPADLELEVAAMEVEPRTEQYEEAGALLLEEEPVFVGSLSPSAIPSPLTQQESATLSSEVSTAAEGSHRGAEPAEIPQELLERAVTDTAERVVTKLAKDMAEKLGERIEQIVREVVPALAENLIVKEIERIKASIEAKPAE